MSETLYHISEEKNIDIFNPLPAPFYTGIITREVVFAINKEMLHNYLLPRNCPRVTYYSGPDTIKEDKNRFIGNSNARYIICVESAWLQEIQKTTLYKYVFPGNSFVPFDETAGYFISFSPVTPIKVMPIYNILEELLATDVELRFMPSIFELGESVKQSTLKFSLIRMNNIGLRT